jgi:hypothetical protein
VETTDNNANDDAFTCLLMNKVANVIEATTKRQSL